MTSSKHQYHPILSPIFFIELLVALSLFLAVCGIQLTHDLDAFEAVHLMVAALFSIPLYLFRLWLYKRQPQAVMRHRPHNSRYRYVKTFISNYL